MKHLIVFNPSAGNHGAAEAFRALIKEKFAGLDYEIYETTGPRSVIPFLKDYLPKQKDTVRVYACGGDGTVHEVANGLVGQKNAELAIYPAGTGNDFVKTFPVLSGGFEIETEMTIHAVYNHLQIDNVVIEYRDRPSGSASKLHTFTDGFRVLSTILELYRDYRPFRFFGTLALLLALAAILFFIPVWREYLQTGMVDRFPTLIVCGFTMLAATESLFAGMILESLEKRNRREFELSRLELGRRRKADGE